MIQLKGGPQDVMCTKSITEFVEGKKYPIQIMKMSGRTYKPGKHMVEGKHEWIDKEGEPENRLMMFGSGVYCCNTKEFLDQHFESL